LLQINGPNGRWKDSNLANLLGEEKAVAVEGKNNLISYFTVITKLKFNYFQVKCKK
jgi:hypothetical protein